MLWHLKRTDIYTKQSNNLTRWEWTKGDLQLTVCMLRKKWKKYCVRPYSVIINKHENDNDGLHDALINHAVTMAPKAALTKNTGLVVISAPTKSKSREPAYKQALYQNKSIGMQTQSALEFFPIHCPNGRLGQDLGFGEFAFDLELPELLNRNLAAVRAKLGQIWFPIGQWIWEPDWGHWA